MKKHYKTYSKKMTKRQVKIRKRLAFLLFVCIFLTGFWGMMNDFDTFAVAEVNIPKDSLSMREWVLAEVEKAGLDPYEAYNIIQCESRWNDQAINVNAKHKSVDIGLWQINNKFHPDVSVECAADYKCATKEAIRIYKERGNSWDAWVCSAL